jgi:hypothetical protein
LFVLFHCESALKNKKIMRTAWIFWIAILFLTSNNLLQGHTRSSGILHGEIIISWERVDKSNTFSSNLKLRELNIQKVRTLSTNRPIYLYKFTPSAKISSMEVLSEISAHPGVAGAEYNRLVEPRAIPDDPYFGQQWGLTAMEVEAVWNTTKGGQTIGGKPLVIAVIDFGFDATHPDLIPNLWVNPAEVPGDGVDNDGNGYIDDINGWNFISNSAVENKGAHGTSVAGIIGAAGNNGIGVSGINWACELMLLSIQSGADIIEAYEYVLYQRTLYNETQGAEGALIVVTNASFGVNEVFCEEVPIWAGQYDLLGAQGVLTACATANNGNDVETFGDMPTTCPSDYIITTLNVDQTGEKVSDSAYGILSVDLGSPGEGSYSTKPRGEYGIFGGTSAAAPHLAGTIALMYALPCLEIEKKLISNPSEVALLIREAIIQGVTPLPALEEYTATSGMLNAYQSAVQLASYCNNEAKTFSLMNIWPNPTQSDLNLEIQVAESGNYTLSVFNLLGAKLYQRNYVLLDFQSAILSLELSFLPQGYYVVSVEKDEERVVKPFLVQ